MYNRAFNLDNRYRAHKLSVGKGSLKLRLQHSKRNNSKTKNKLNNLSINNDKNNIQNSKINANNSVINKNTSTKDHSKDNKNQRSKVLSITSNTNELINYNNYLTNDNINNDINNDINISSNENMNNSYIHITLNSNNPYINQNIINITEEKEKEKEKDKNQIKYPLSGDIKYNITVNKKHQKY
jgi:hypothetical protein